MMDGTTSHGREQREKADRSRVGVLARLPIIAAVAIVSGAMAMKPAHAGPVFGGFDYARGGKNASLRDGDMTVMRADIYAQYSQAQITATYTLTPAYFSTVDVVVLTPGFDNFSAIVPLSISEQQALRQFVNGGGAAIIMTDNMFSTANQDVMKSFLDPFGMSAAGLLTGQQPATVAAGSHPLTASVTTLVGYYSGWYDQMGPATAMAWLNSNGQQFMGLIDWGALQPGSGAVVFVADSIFNDEVIGFGDNATFARNAIAYTGSSPVPEIDPAGMGSVLALVTGALGLLERRRLKTA